MYTWFYSHSWNCSTVNIRAKTKHFSKWRVQFMNKWSSKILSCENLENILGIIHTLWILRIVDIETILYNENDYLIISWDEIVCSRICWKYKKFCLLYIYIYVWNILTPDLLKKVTFVTFRFRVVKYSKLCFMDKPVKWWNLQCTLP